MGGSISIGALSNIERKSCVDGFFKEAQRALAEGGAGLGVAMDFVRAGACLDSYGNLALKKEHVLSLAEAMCWNGMPEFAATLAESLSNRSYEKGPKSLSDIFTWLVADTGRRAKSPEAKAGMSELGMSLAMECQKIGWNLVPASWGYGSEVVGPIEAGYMLGDGFVSFLSASGVLRDQSGRLSEVALTGLSNRFAGREKAQPLDSAFLSMAMDKGSLPVGFLEKTVFNDSGLERMADAVGKEQLLDELAAVTASRCAGVAKRLWLFTCEKEGFSDMAMSYAKRFSWDDFLASVSRSDAGKATPFEMIGPTFSKFGGWSDLVSSLADEATDGWNAMLARVPGGPRRELALDGRNKRMVHLLVDMYLRGYRQEAVTMADRTGYSFAEAQDDVKWLRTRERASSVPQVRKKASDLAVAIASLVEEASMEKALCGRSSISGASL